MEVIKKKTVFKVFFFLAYLVLSFVFRKFIFVGSYKESILMVHLCFIAVYLITFNNDIMKHECYKKKLDISITTIVIALFPLFIYGIYEFIRDLYLPHNFLTTNYDTANLGFFVELLDFIFLYRAYGFDIGSLAIIDAGISLMSIVMVSQEDYSKREKSGKFENTVLNVARKLGKMYFKYRFFIVFLISICMAPQNYIFIRRLSYIIIAASLVYGLVSIYIYIKSIYEIEKYSKNKKLVLLVTLDNFDDNLLYEKNMLKQFFKYRLEKSLNNLSIETSRFVIARYELVRNRLINLKDYKDVSYLICYENKKINDLTIDTIKNFESEIEKIAKNSEKFAILEINDYNGKNHFTKIMKDKYKEDFKVNVAFETVLEDLLEKEENVYLKNSVENIINEIEQKIKNEDKNVILASNFILESLKSINTSDATRSYYTLMKICEYIVHYRALKLISINRNVKIDSILRTSFGSWISYQKTNSQKIKDEDLVNAVNQIKACLELKDSIQYSFDGICSFVSSIRNKTIGHGVITYMVAKKIVNYFEILTELLIREFFKFEYILDENDCIANVLGKDIKCYINKDNELYLYNYANNDLYNNYEFEYLNYNTGKIISEGETRNIILNSKIGEM